MQFSDISLLSRRETLWLTGAGVALIATSYGLARFAYGLFVPVFREEYALTAATAGAIASGSYISYSIAIVAATVLAPRLGGRKIAMIAGIVATAGMLIVAAAPSAAVLAIGVLVAGTSTGVASPPLAYAVAHTVQHHIRNRTQTIINSGTGVGVAIAVPIALLTTEHWRLAWLAFAVVTALVTFWVARSVPSGPAYGKSGSSLRDLLPQPLLPKGSGLLITAAGLMGLSSTAIWTFGRDLLMTTGGLSETTSAIAWVFLGGVGVLGAASGDLGYRWGIRKSWRLVMLVLGGATVLFALFPDNYIIAWIASAAFGIAYIGVSGLLLIWGTNVYPYTPASGVGIAFLVIAIGQAIGSPLIGAITEVSGPRIAFLVAAAIAVAAAFLRPVSARRSRTPKPTTQDVQDIA